MVFLNISKNADRDSKMAGLHEYRRGSRAELRFFCLSPIEVSKRNRAKRSKERVLRLRNKENVLNETVKQVENKGEGATYLLQADFEEPKIHHTNIEFYDDVASNWMGYDIDASCGSIYSKGVSKLNITGEIIIKTPYKFNYWTRKMVIFEQWSIQD